MLSLILPVYNAELDIESVVNEALDQISRVFESFEIIVVDAGSQEHPSPIAAQLAAAHLDQLRIIHHNLNRGYGAALTTGFRAARGDYLMFMDASGQLKLADLKLFAPYIGQADIVVGYRKNRPFNRFLISHAFNAIGTFWFGIHLRDPNCGFKLFKAEVLKKMDLTLSGALINTEIHAKAQLQGRSIIEVGVDHYPYLVGQQSRVSARLLVSALLETILLWVRLRSYAPSQDFENVPPRQITSKPLPGFNLAAGIGFFLGFMLWRFISRNHPNRK